jgi:uncharacterized protein YndB with AHSA1/START domain
MLQRTVSHAMFVIERDYPNAASRLFAAWSSLAAKSRWFVGPPDWKETLREMDFRIGGRERLSGTFPNGKVSAFDACYQDIVPNERIVYTYDQHINGIRISVSLATIQFKSAGSGTRLVLTEQGAFLDGHESPAGREHGTRVLMGQLGASLLK